MKVTKLRKEILFAAMDIFKEQFENKERGANKLSNETYFNNFKNVLREKLTPFTLPSKKQQRGVDSDVYLYFPVCETKSIGDKDDSNDDKVAWLEFKNLTTKKISYIRVPKDSIDEENKIFDLRHFNDLASPFAFEFKTVKGSHNGKSILFSPFNGTPPHKLKELTYEVKYKGEKYKLKIVARMFYIIVNDDVKRKEICKIFVCSGNSLNPGGDSKSPPSEYKPSEMNNDIVQRKIYKNQGVGSVRLRVFMKVPSIDLQKIKDLKDYNGLFWCFDDAIKTENGYEYNYEAINFTSKTGMVKKLEDIKAKNEATN
jgi:hypothetical protein